jgi:translation elongation factor EF-Tu-like GTPase
MEKDPDFIAQLQYKTTEDGGRKTPAFSGYRPQIKFPFSEMVTSGQQTFLDKDIVYPGETVKASIRIISIDFFENSLKEDMQFEFREGSNIIGTGVVIEIINKRLKKI